ncbi:hypothetical protein ACFWYW_17195 [Nonomuraea sp. NPDC059023]|uniref:hypothetical protein n=1 Tax=unclassified Nonomuraea TaxID=2593643 RepID=UPI0036AA4BBD
MSCNDALARLKIQGSDLMLVHAGGDPMNHKQRSRPSGRWVSKVSHLCRVVSSRAARRARCW